MTENNEPDDEISDPRWANADMLLSDSLGTYVEDRIREAKSEGISLKALYCALLVYIDRTFADMAPEIDGPLLHSELAIIRKDVPGAE